MTATKPKYTGDTATLARALAAMRAEPKKAGTALLQRKLNLSYVKAATVLDELERRGAVAARSGYGPRRLLKDEP